jgi:hypothetical protein
MDSRDSVAGLNKSLEQEKSSLNYTTIHQKDSSLKSSDELIKSLGLLNNFTLNNQKDTGSNSSGNGNLPNNNNHKLTKTYSANINSNYLQNNPIIINPHILNY